MSRRQINVATGVFTARPHESAVILRVMNGATVAVTIELSADEAKVLRRLLKSAVKQIAEVTDAT